MKAEEIYDELWLVLEPFERGLPDAERKVVLDGLIDTASRVLERRFQFKDRDSEAAWLAGLLEGEGCFVGDPRPERHSVSIRLLMTDKDAVDTAASIMGGRVSVKRGNNWPEEYKTPYLTSVNGDKAVEVMKRILPYMHTRRREKIICLLEKASNRIASWRKGKISPTCHKGHDKHGKGYCSMCQNERRRERRKAAMA